MKTIAFKGSEKDQPRRPSPALCRLPVLWSGPACWLGPPPGDAGTCPGGRPVAAAAVRHRGLRPAGGETGDGRRSWGPRWEPRSAGSEVASSVTLSNLLSEQAHLSGSRRDLFLPHSLLGGQLWGGGPRTPLKSPSPSPPMLTSHLRESQAPYLLTASV